MGPTNIVAHELESYGVRTFSAKEMAFNILALMHPLLFSITQVEPIWADLNGGMDKLPDLADITTRIRSNLMKKSELCRAIALDNSGDFNIVNGVEAERLSQTVNVTPAPTSASTSPLSNEAYESLSDLSSLQGMVDLEKVMVITGFSEVGPRGSLRCIEMTWIMGYIKHFDGRLKNGPVPEGYLGVRLIEPELFWGYDPKKKVFDQSPSRHQLGTLQAEESYLNIFEALGLSAAFAPSRRFPQSKLVSFCKLVARRFRKTTFDFACVD
ncbi:hypothetical protein K438DRAFT_1985985 [Mycena galopus ATCC 62051]|nr:hypothetical protein K438DRAFT_1985985 [Mycena galopus ATCC 62051]